MRRKQLQALDIPYKILLNGALPEGYILQEDEEYTPEEPMTPTMALKFMRGCRSLAKSGLPDYIIRVNSSTFVDFANLARLLDPLPRQKCFAGHIMHLEEGPKITEFMHGTAMIFSKDIIEYLLVNAIPDNKYITDYPDDVSLSIIARQYCGYLIDLRPLYKFFVYNTTLPSQLVFETHHIFFRILNHPNRMEIDVKIWEKLYDYFVSQ
jgi:hypothetical protein